MVEKLKRVSGQCISLERFPIGPIRTAVTNAVYFVKKVRRWASYFALAFCRA
jgi:hypothetical protein